MAALGDEALEWLVGPRLRKRFGIWMNLLARIVLQQPPEPFIAQVGAILDATDELRFELVQRPRPHARDHRLAGLAHARRRRRGARRADPARPARGAQRRGARPHGRGAERVQRRGAATSSLDVDGLDAAIDEPRRRVRLTHSSRRAERRQSARTCRESAVLAVAGDEVVDEAADAADDLGVEALGRGEHLVGACGLVACRAERGVDRAVRRRELARLVDLVVVELAAEQLAQRRACDSSAKITGSVYTPSMRSLPAGLPSDASEPVTSSTSSTIWKHMPRWWPNSVSASSVGSSTSDDHPADAARGREQRRGLAVDRGEVDLLAAVDVEEVLQLEHLAAAQLADRLREQRGDRRAERRRELRRARQQVVAGEDRDDVAPARVHARNAAPGLGLVDHVVVVERSEVDELDRHRAGDRGVGGRARRPWAAYPVQRVRAGRRRFPPALTRWEATSPRKGSSERTAAASSASTRSRSAASGSSPSAASGCICAGYGVVGTNSKPEVSFFLHTSPDLVPPSGGPRTRRWVGTRTWQRVGIRSRVGANPAWPIQWTASRREADATVFERFTDRARRVVVLAQEEARLLNHNYIGTEHILLGLIHEGEGVAAKALESLGISLEAVRAQVEEIIGHGGSAPSGHIPFTPARRRSSSSRSARRSSSATTTSAPSTSSSG